jgi:hypothetical protein
MSGAHYIIEEVEDTPKDKTEVKKTKNYTCNYSGLPSILSYQNNEE